LSSDEADQADETDLNIENRPTLTTRDGKTRRPIPANSIYKNFSNLWQIHLAQPGRSFN
jgi:hypothetical protein